jgi:hypothetical protein
MEPGGELRHPTGTSYTFHSLFILNTQALYFCVFSDASKQAAFQQLNHSEPPLLYRGQPTNRIATFAYLQVPYQCKGCLKATGSWGPPSLLSNGYHGTFPGYKASGAWSYPLTSKINGLFYFHFHLKASLLKASVLNPRLAWATPFSFCNTTSLCTYGCEQLFSLMKNTKSRTRKRLPREHLQEFTRITAKTMSSNRIPLEQSTVTFPLLTE